MPQITCKKHNRTFELRNGITGCLECAAEKANTEDERLSKIMKVVDEFAEACHAYGVDYKGQYSSNRSNMINSIRNRVVEVASEKLRSTSTKDISLNKPEHHILELIAQMTGEFSMLPVQDQNDLQQFEDLCIRLEHLIAIRVARRAEPEVW